MPVAAAHDASQPVLPPRPTLRGQTAEPRALGWRSWPVFVIILATLAIVAAVVLMVWPSDRRDLNNKHMLGPPPAPDRMQTVPEIQPPPQVPNRQAPAAPPQNGPTRDPWTGQIDPPPQDLRGNPFGKDDKDDKDIDDDSQDLSLVDPFSTPRPPSAAPGRRQLPLNGTGMVLRAVSTHVCRKLIQCGTNNPTTKHTCDALAGMPSAPPPNCPAADRCLQYIDTLGCGSQTNDFAQLITLMLRFRDCADATRC